MGVVWVWSVLVLVFGGGVVLCGCCVVVWCGVVRCVFVSFFSFFSQILCFLFLALSLSFFSLLFSPPNTVERTDQPTRRPTSRLLNVIWRRAGAQQSVLSLLPSLPPLLKKKRRELFITRIFPAREFFLLQFYINSEKSPPGEITDITVLN